MPLSRTSDYLRRGINPRLFSCRFPLLLAAASSPSPDSTIQIDSMGNKKFINKKKSAKFEFLARDSSSSSYFDSVSDRVFVRSDNNPYDCPDIADDLDQSSVGNPAAGPLSERIRREIREQGLDDDGYNYLVHLRPGGGAVFYENRKAMLEPPPPDVKAYDASGLQILRESSEEESEGLVFAEASKIKGIKVQKAVDPDVARLLFDSDLSLFGSDVEEMEDDFVVRANFLEEGEGEGEEENEVNEEETDDGEEEDEDREFTDVEVEMPRVRRLLDEQFDLLTLQEYGNDSDSDDDIQHNDSKCVLLDKEFALNDLEFTRKFRDTVDPTAVHQGSIKVTDFCASKEIITRCAQYAERYMNESQDDEDVVLVEDSSDESQAWDCETIVSTYSNLDNHPGRIESLVNPRKRFPKSFTGATDAMTDLIALGGKDKIPFEYLPHKMRVAGKVKTEVCAVAGKSNHRPRGDESKDEKKERKGAIKEEKRAARRAKKELRSLYKCEGQIAQIVAASSGPSAIHLA